MRDGAELVAVYELLKADADAGDQLAAKMIGWLDQLSSYAGVSGTYPTDPIDELRLLGNIANTSEMYWSARLMRWRLNHPGQEPTHFTFTIDIDFEAL